MAPGRSAGDPQCARWLLEVRDCPDGRRARRCGGLGMAYPVHRAGRAIVSGVVVPHSIRPGRLTGCHRIVPCSPIIVMRRGAAGQRAIRHTPQGAWAFSGVPRTESQAQKTT